MTIIEAIEKILGFIVCCSAIGVMALLYHMLSQDTWKSITHDEYEEKIDQEIERRWKSQQVCVHYSVCIVDEMNKKEDCYYDDYCYRKSV